MLYAKEAEIITKVEAIKRYFGREKPVKNSELIHFRKEDKEGFDELAEGAAKELGKEGRLFLSEGG